MAPDATSHSQPPSKPAMPPGMVMGPDGKPCKICTSFRNWKPPTDAGSSAGKSKQKAGGTAAMMAALASGSAAKTPDQRPADCPPDVEELGRATWAFLHTTAAYYPEKPTPRHRANMLALLSSLPIIYPCSWCAMDFGDNLKKNPPDVSTRERLSRWLCEQHNEVNEKLGKSKFDCAKVDERWKDGPSDGRCD